MAEHLSRTRPGAAGAPRANRGDIPPSRGETRLLRLRDHTLTIGGRTLLMGILNVTPDSFYDGGRHDTAEKALERALLMASDGADIIDVGGESTRPASLPVDPGEEWRRVGPVIGELVARGIVVSVDTCKSTVARLALEAGAVLVNDISGGTMDERLFTVAAQYGAGLVITHIQGTPKTMQREPHYTNVMEEIARFLAGQAGAAQCAGVRPESVIVDPGIGFGKLPEHNLHIIRHLAKLSDLGYPVMVGHSRKSFIGHVTGLPPEERLEGSLGAAAAAAIYGADILRVHDVKETSRLLAVLDAIRRSGECP